MKDLIIKGEVCPLETAVTRLKELADHCYVDEPDYDFINLKPETPHTPIWHCVCRVRGWDDTDGYGPDKPKAKKVAALKMLYNVTAY